MKISRYTSDELKWFYNNSFADIGVKSSWVSCCNAACYGSYPVADPYTDHMLKSVKRRRLIEKTLFALPEVNQLALYALYSYDSKLDDSFYAVDGRGNSKLNIEYYYGNLALVACCILPADQLNALCKKSRLGKTNKEDKAVMAMVRVMADKLKEESIRLYSEQRRFYGNRI
jgi:hypothetical protein